MQKPLAGIHVALLTGFNDDGALDPGRQVALARCALAQRIDGLYVGGSSAEQALLTPDELARQQEIVAEAAEGSGKTLIAHVGVPALREALRLAGQAERLGYHGLSALPPHGFAHDFAEIRAYYERLAAETALPLVIYEVPARTARPTPVAEMIELLALPGVEGLKFTSPDLYRLSRIRKIHPDKTVFFGMDEMFAAAAALGVDGGIGTTYNVIGGLYTDIRDAVGRSDLATARHLQMISQDLVEHLLAAGVIPGTKWLLGRLGVDAGPPRLPLASADRDTIERFERWLELNHLAPWLEYAPTHRSI